MTTPWLVKIGRAWLLFLVFAIPFSLRYITKEPFAISYLNLLSVGFIGLTALNGLLGAFPKYKIESRYFVITLILFIVAISWGFLNSEPLRSGFGIMTSRGIQPILVGYGAFLYVRNGYLLPSRIFGSLFASLIGLIIVSALQWGGVLALTDPQRITATYFYPNTFARYMVILMMLTLPWIIFGIKKYKRVLLGLWLLGIVVLLSTVSYNGTVSIVIGLSVIVILLPKELNKVKLLYFGCILIGGLIIGLNATKLPKWETSITSSRLTRLEFWDTAAKTIKDHYWTGIGLKGWETRYPELVVKYHAIGRFPLNWGSPQPHNVVLDSLLKAGIIGFIGIIGLLVWPAVSGLRYVKLKGTRKGWIGLSVVAYGVAMLFFGIIDDPLWSDDTVPLLFIVSFLLVSQLIQTHEKN